MDCTAFVRTENKRHLGRETEGGFGVCLGLLFVPWFEVEEAETRTCR